MSEPIIAMKGIGKKYLRFERRFLFKDAVRHLIGRYHKPVDFWALKDIDLEIYSGESVGIIGENGSGKSTLLKILSNITDATEGEMKINGRISSLLELGAGFHPYLTGRENIYLNGVILGMKKRFIDRVFDDIVEFSGIRDFIDTPVQNYSSGMYVRLGFSIAVHLDPDILIVDEVLSVGDEEFQRKCKKKIMEFHRAGKTILFVSHDMSAVRNLCDRLYWLKDGRIKMEGTKDIVTSRYLQYVGAKEGLLTLSKDRISFIFDNGKIIMFWRGIELTKNCCIFTSIIANATWHGSLIQQWEVLSFDKTHFTARGTWKMIPVTQIWNFSIVSEHEIVWEVQMEILDEINASNDTADIMLTDRYTKWRTPGKIGDFPPDFHEEFGQRLIGVGQNETQIGAEGFTLGNIPLPSVDFKLVAPENEFLCQVTNTDSRTRARTLQFSRIRDADVYHKSEKLFFSSRILIQEVTRNE